LDKQRGALGGDLLIGQNVFDREKFRFGKKEGIGQPVRQALMQQLLAADARTDDPERFWNLSGDDGDEKGASRFENMGESNRPFAAPNRFQSLRDRFGVRDDF